MSDVTIRDKIVDAMLGSGSWNDDLDEVAAAERILAIPEIVAGLARSGGASAPAGRRWYAIRFTVDEDADPDAIDFYGVGGVGSQIGEAAFLHTSQGWEMVFHIDYPIRLVSVEETEGDPPLWSRVTSSDAKPDWSNEKDVVAWFEAASDDELRDAANGEEADGA